MCSSDLKKVKEVEMYAAEDKQKKESIETRNQTESLVYQTEKTLKDLEGKISAEDSASLTQANDELKKALETNNPDDIKVKTDALTAKFNEVSTKLYQQPGAQAGQAGPDMGQSFDAGQTGTGAQSGLVSGGNDNVVDADYTVVDDDNKQA